MDAIPIWLQDTTNKRMTEKLKDAAGGGDCEAIKDELVSGNCHIHAVRYIPPYSTFGPPMTGNDTILKLIIKCTF